MRKLHHCKNGEYFGLSGLACSLSREQKCKNKSADLMIFDRPQGNAGAPPPDRAAKQRRPHRPPLEKPQNFLRRCAPLQS